MQKSFTLAALALGLALFAGTALGGSTGQPSVGADMAELGCSPSAAAESALDGPRCRTLAQAMFAFDGSLANAQQTLSDASAAQDTIKEQLDALDELSSEDAANLQAAMDRRTKLLDALSNVMKKLSDTQSAITGNLK